MKYTKKPLTFNKQVDLLVDRGLAVADRDLLLVHLNNVNYYRLSAYWYPFRLPDETLKPGTTFEMIWRRYTFDRQLRLLVMDAIERVEIAAHAVDQYIYPEIWSFRTFEKGQSSQHRPRAVERSDL